MDNPSGGQAFEILGHHRRQSQQGRLELGPRLSSGFEQANNVELTPTGATKSVPLCAQMRKRQPSVFTY
jgi:hypothetical protein